MGRHAFLEDFDPPEDDASPEPAGPGADWLEGHAAGRAEAMAEVAAAEDRLGEALVQSVADMGFGYAEARRHVLAALRPLVETLLSRILPAIAQDSLKPALAEAILEAAATDADAPLTLRAHPAQAPLLRAWLAETTLPPLEIVPDPDLLPEQLLLTDAAGAGTALDPAPLLSGMRETLSALFHDQDLRIENG